MNKPLSRDEVEAAARTLVSAQSSALGTEVTTPVVYPNGDCVVVLVAPNDARYVVHDAGLGAMYLTREGVRINRESEQRFGISAARYDCRYEGGRMVRRCEAADVAVSIMLVANASRSVADLATEARRQSEGHFRHVLTERVREIVGLRLRENESFKGVSGTTYRIANTILDQQAREPVAFVVPVPTRSSVNPQFRELFDLKAAFPDIFRDSVYNEGSDFRPQEDGWVLRQVGSVTPLGALRSELEPMLDALPSRDQPPFLD
jgi:hypothetical protein